MSLLSGLSRLFGTKPPKKPAGTGTQTRTKGAPRVITTSDAPGRNGAAATRSRPGSKTGAKPVVVEAGAVAPANAPTAPAAAISDGAGDDALGVVVEPKTDTAGARKPPIDLDADAPGSHASGPGVIEPEPDPDPIGVPDAEADAYSMGDIGRARFLPVVRSRQELIADLQKRYTEVVDLMKRVDTHLDEQSRRQERLLEIAESVPEALAQLPEMHEQTKRLIEATNGLTEATVRSANRSNAAMTKQKAAIDQLVQHTADSAHTQTQVVSSLVGLTEGVSQMHEAGTQIGEAVDSLRRHESARDEAITAAVKDQRRVTTVAAAASIAAALSIIALVVLIATNAV